MSESIAFPQALSTGMNGMEPVSMILDDASRMVLAGGEFFEINTENIKLIIDQMVERYWWLCPLNNGSWRIEFKDHLKKYGIKPILARIKHPQTNGKL